MELYLDREDFECTINFCWEAQTLAALCTGSLICAGTRKSWVITRHWFLRHMKLTCGIWCSLVGWGWAEKLQNSSWVSVRVTAEDNLTEAACCHAVIPGPVPHKVKWAWFSCYSVFDSIKCECQSIWDHCWQSCKGNFVIINWIPVFSSIWVFIWTFYFFILYVLVQYHTF